MCDGRIVLQDLIYLACIRHSVVFFMVDRIVDPGMFYDILHTFSVCSLCTDQEFLVCSDHAGKYRFHTKSTASLHQNGSVFILRYMCKFQQYFSDLLSDTL